MRYVLFAYIGLFGISCLVMIVKHVFVTPDEEREPLGETLTDVFCLGVLLAGMVFLACGVTDPILRKIWLVAAPCVVALQLWLSWRDRSREKQKLEPTTDAAPSFLFPDVGTLLLTLPALAFNLSFALGKP